MEFNTVLRANPADAAARRYLGHAAQAAVSGVPADWDGSETMSEK